MKYGGQRTPSRGEFRRGRCKRNLPTPPDDWREPGWYEGGALGYLILLPFGVLVALVIWFFHGH